MRTRTLLALLAAPWMLLAACGEPRPSCPNGVCETESGGGLGGAAGGGSGGAAGGGGGGDLGGEDGGGEDGGDLDGGIDGGSIDGGGTGDAGACPVPATVAQSMLNAYANGTTLRMPSGRIATFVLPAPTLNKSTGIFRLYAGTSTFPIDPYYFEVHINKCRGLVQETPGDSCYGRFRTSTGYYNQVWFTQTLSGNAAYDTVAEIEAAGHCYAPPAEGPWYVNIRYVYAGCNIAGNCGWNYQWYNWGF